MTFAALSFAAGAALLQLQPTLPAWGWGFLLPVLGLSLYARPGLAVPIALCIGFLWASTFAHLRLADRLAADLEGRDLEVTGVVAGLPASGERGARFEFEVESAERGVPRKLRLFWYRRAAEEDGAAPLAAAIHPGERWLLTVRLRRPHGNVNPHGFDYEAWLLERGIGATGYVSKRGSAVFLGERKSFSDTIEKTREAVRDRFFAVLEPGPAPGILAALAVGDQYSIAGEEWLLFQRTGVTHLMSISGLHVTLVSGLLAWLAGFAWRRVPRACLLMPARKVAAVTAIAAALGYTLLAGFAVPAQRTFWMVTVVALALWSGRVASPGRTLALALGAVVLADPWAPLAAGFWLSFGAVALIFYVAAGWSAPHPRAVQWARVQWAITIGLAPAALLLFSQVSLAGPLANAVAIPLVSVVVTPLALAAAAIPADPLLLVAAWLVERLLEFLDWCGSLPLAVWQQHAPPLWAVLAGLAGVAWLLAPRGVPWRICGAALMAPAFALAPPAPAQGEAWATVLDVGQGLAILVRTAGHALLYDAGPAFGADSDAGARLVLPALRAAGIERLDVLVLSHDDSDHIGGAASVLAGLEVGALVSSLAAAHPLGGLAPERRRCARGDAWEWDGVRFELLHPAPGGAARRRNDQSCVLRLASRGGSMLLTGDIERSAEGVLLNGNLPLKSDVLLVPHHGSRSSSSAEFLAAVAPRWALVTAGYRSRFGHPHAEVLERYRAAGAQLLRTDLDGALAVTLGPQGIGVGAERARRGRYWLQ